MFFEKRADEILALIFTALFLSILSCSTNSTSSDSGSASFRINWMNTVSSDQIGYRSANLDCSGLGISAIDVEVYTSTNTYLTGKQFECDAGSGTINNIESGSDRKFVVLGSDANGNVLYRGEKTGIAIINGQNTDVGTINVYPLFIGTVTITGKILKNGQPVPGIQMFLAGIDNQNQYRVVVSEESVTDSAGIYTFSFEFLSDTSYDIMNNMNYIAPNSFKWWWYVFNEGIHSEQIVMPDLDIYYNDLYSPPDNATFTVNEIGDSNPVNFQWTDGGNEDIQGFQFCLHDEFGACISFFGSDGQTSYAFDGMRDDESMITPGTYTWRVICNFSLVGDGWSAETKEKTIIFE